jgi:sugar lactone lactonase YvrE
MRELTALKATLAVDCQDIIGEGPAWDSSRQRLLWCDNSVGLIHEGRSNGPSSWHETRRWALNRPIAAAVPRAAGGLLVAGGVEFLTLSDTGDLRFIARLDADPQSVKLNDAKCDSRGRLWAGTRDLDFSVPGRKITPGRAALYRLDPDGAVVTMLTGATLCNGLDWSPEGSIFYFIDTYSRTIDAFDFDIDQGSISNRRNVITLYSDEGLPDGMTVDRDGNLWVAIAGAGEVGCYSPDGSLLARVRVGTPTVTSCAFGGIAGTDLFITTARVRLPAIALSGLTQGFSLEVGDSREAGAGGLYVCQPGLSGLPAHNFAG